MAEQQQDKGLWGQIVGLFTGGGQQAQPQPQPQQKAPVYVTDFYGSDYAKESPYSSSIISSPQTQVNKQGQPVNQPQPTVNAPGGNPQGGASTTKSKAQLWAESGGKGDVPVGWNGAQSSIDEQKQREEMEARQRAAIDASFQPIFAELDRQLGSLPGQKTTLEDQIASLVGSQQTTAENARTRGLAQLDNSANIEKENTQGALRNLEQDIRNHLQAQQFYFGALGAGDSSAPIMASEAIARAGLKSRSGVLNTQNRALNDIELKKADVNNLATDQLGKIDSWKSQQMFNIGQWYQDQVNKLNQEKANAGSERGRAIAQLIQGLDQDFLARARQLDDEARNYKNSIQTWQMQRAAELEDYQTKLSLSSKYGGTQDNSKAYMNAINAFNTLSGINVPAGAAQQSVYNNLGVDPLGGATLTQEQLDAIKKNQSAQDQYYQQMLDSTTQQPTQQKSGLLGFLGM